VFSLTSAANPSAALCQLWLGASTWPSLMSRAWAGAARAMPAVASRVVRVRVSCMVFTLGCCCLGAFRAGWRQLAQAAAAEIFSQACQDADQVIVHGVARPYGVA